MCSRPHRPLPWPWLSEAEFDYFVREYTRGAPATTFIGGLNSYRVADRNWELGAAFADANITQPALFIAGADDVVLKMIPADAPQIMQRRVPQLKDDRARPRCRSFRAAGGAGRR